LFATITLAGANTADDYDDDDEDNDDDGGDDDTLSVVGTFYVFVPPAAAVDHLSDKIIKQA
jgi:hypothetical protein